MIDLQQHVTVPHLRRGEDLIDGLHRRARDIRRGEHGHPVSRRAGKKYCREQSDQFLSISHAIGIFGEAGIVGEFRASKRGAETFPNRFAGGAEDQKIIGGLKTLVGHDGRMGVAPTAGDFAAD